MSGHSEPNWSRNLKWRIVECILLGCSVTAFMIALSYYYTHAPTQPDVASGRTYALNNHGYVTYLTGSEAMYRIISFSVFGVTAICALGIDLIINPFGAKRRTSAVKRVSSSD
jgi:hypothetical protein